MSKNPSQRVTEPTRLYITNIRRIHKFLLEQGNDHNIKKLKDFVARATDLLIDRCEKTKVNEIVQNEFNFNKSKYCELGINSPDILLDKVLSHIKSGKIL